MDNEIEKTVVACVQAAQAGDRVAFGRLVERYQGAVFAQCRRLASNRADAEDLAHDTFVQAFTQIRQLREPNRFGGWLKTIALNLYRSHLRQDYREKISLETGPATAAVPEVDERWQQVEENLWRLSPAQRLVLALHYWEGLSYEEIARFTDVPLGTVMSRLYRARNNLKNGVDQSDNGAADMNETPDLKREIDAEIEALTRLFAEDPEVMERLSVLLQHAPARFARLIEEMAPAEVDSLVLLLRRLGSPAVAVVLDCYFGGEDPVRARALALLTALVEQDQDWHWDTNWANGETLAHITQTTYGLLDRIIACSVSDEEKVALLLALAKAARPGHSPGRLCWTTMLCYPQAALSHLCERLQAMPEGDIQATPLEMGILLRFGTAGCRAVNAWLDDERVERRRLGLMGLVALNGRLNPTGPGGVLAKASGDARFRDHEHLLNRDLEPAVLQELSERAVALAAGDDREAREAALMALGAMRRSDESVVAVLGDCLDCDWQPTRLAALKALGEIALGEHRPKAFVQVEDRVVALAEAEDWAEQVAALTALGRLQVEAARPLLTERAEGAESAEVREAAVNGLGQIGGEESAALLRRLQVVGSKDLRKKASRWLQRLHTEEQSPSPAQLARQKRLAHLKGEREASTQVWASYRVKFNLGAALRSLPEARVYPETELTRYFAEVCVDYSLVRRVLADRGLLYREQGMCTLTEAGQRAWRVEYFIRDRYLLGAPA